MKIRTLFILATALLTLASCEKDENADPSVLDQNPGEIPGLGSTEGDLTGTLFELPDGVALNGEITGNGSTSGYWNDVHEYALPRKDGTTVLMTSLPKTRAETATGHFGSGMGFVTLRIPLHNENSSPTTVVFPAATIVRSVSGEIQNGVLIKKVTVTIPANTDYVLNLAFYCGNEDKDAAWGEDKFEWGVVSNSAPLLDLCERVKNKKINIEEYDPTDPSDRETYESHLFMLQAAVWAVTDGDGLSDFWLIPYLESLPNS